MCDSVASPLTARLDRGERHRAEQIQNAKEPSPGRAAGCYRYHVPPGPPRDPGLTQDTTSQQQSEAVRCRSVPSRSANQPEIVTDEAIEGAGSEWAQQDSEVDLQCTAIAQSALRGVGRLLSIF